MPLRPPRKCITGSAPAACWGIPPSAGWRAKWKAVLAGAAARERPASRLPHQPRPGLQQPARGPRRSTLGEHRAVRSRGSAWRWWACRRAMRSACAWRSSAPKSVPVFFEIDEPPDSKAVMECHLAVVYVRPEMGRGAVARSRAGNPFCRWCSWAAATICFRSTRRCNRWPANS